MIKPVCSQLNFKGISIINVPKKAFSEPEDNRKCFLEFCTKLNEEAYKHSNLSQKCMARMRKKSAKCIVHLIGKGYFEMSKMSDYSPEWVENHTRIPLQKPLYKNTYSFCIFSGKEKNELIKKFNFLSFIKRKMEISKEKEKRIKEEKITDKLWEKAKNYKEVENILYSVANKGIDAQITIGSLDETSEAYDRLSRMNLI